MTNNKTILLTGGTGSFGKEFAKLLLKKYTNNKFKIYIYSRDELKQFEMKNEINDNRVNYIVGDIRDYDRLLNLKIKPNFIVHAAAMKQIVTSELNPSECIKTNILGTQNLLNYSLNLKNCNFLSLSTDKAVNPINLYGATKLCLEKITVASNHINKNNRYSVLRYGNVIGSRGSVIPFFDELARQKKKIPVTDIRMTRFWITLNEAANYALNCLNIMKGGEIFVPKIPSMRIIDLAKSFSKSVKFTGIRKGEKLHEVLISKEEQKFSFYNDKIKLFIINENEINKEKLLYNKKVFKKNLTNKDYDSKNNNDYLSLNQLKRLINVSR